MSLPYEDSTARDPLAELQRALAKFGCATFGVMTDAERGMTIVQFKWRERQISVEASWKGYAAAWLKSHPYSRHNTKATKEQHHAKALAQAQVSIGCVLRDWVKGQITAVECGVMSFEAAFIAHIMLPNGRSVLQQIQADNLLPAPSEKVVSLPNGTSGA